MADETATYIDRVIDEIFNVATNVPQPRDVQDACAHIIERIARRSYSLVCRELVRRVNLESDLYHRGRIDRALQAFEARIEEIPDAIAHRVEVYICEYMRQWVRDILQHGLSERRAEAPERASEEGGGETRNLSGVGAVGRPQRQIEPQPMSRGSESPEAPSELVEQPTGPGSKLHESEMRYIATTLSPSALAGCGRIGSDGAIG